MDKRSHLKELCIRITDRCNSKCRHCNIWQIPATQKQDIPVEFVKRIPPKLQNIVLTGGEPTLYPDIAELILQLREKQPRRITITSNGVDSRKIEKTLEEIRQKDRQVLEKMAFRFSCDGLNDNNDLIRGIPGSTEKLLQSIVVVKKYGIKNIGITQTCSELNVNEIQNVFNFARQHKLQYGLQLAHSSNHFLNNTNVLPNLAVLKENLNFIVSKDIVSLNPRAWFRAYFHSFYYPFAMNDFCRPPVHPCHAGRDYLFITSKGDLKPCPLSENSYGNLFDSTKFTNITDMVCNAEITNKIRNCQQKCWLISTANREIKSNPWLGLVWITKAWLSVLSGKKVIS
jgi:MoaA/NifB/PqqE/SkfB family radical SAM enzyme